MSKKLELIREKKLHKLFPGKKQKKLEASGVYVADESTCYVIFDNLNKVGRVDLKLKSSKSNKLIHLLNVGTGFEDITYDPLSDRFYLIVEALEDKSHGGFRGLVSEYDGDFMFHRCSQLEPAFKNKNKGFEGVEHIRRGDAEYLVGLWEDTLGQDGNKGRGRLYLFPKASDGSWAKPRAINLPASAKFKDFAAIARRGNRVAVVSQKSKRLWLGEINETFSAFVEGTGTTYRFPKKCYGNVEGVSWLCDDRLVMVSDKKKKKQKKCCADKDQSIHIFRIPSG